MLRTAASKVAWVGRTASMVFGLALVMALVIGVASTAWSATGGNFLLGKANTATTASKLTASVAGPALSLVNQSTDAAATALNISVASGKPPLKVNAAAGTATNLSADKLDGRSSEEFLGKTEKAADAAHADSADHATTAQSAESASSAGDADTLDGQDSTDFLGANSKAADSETLDGKDSAQFFQGAGQTVDGRATMSSGEDSTAPVTNIPGFGSISVVQEFGAPGNDCRAVFRNESGGQLFRLGIRDNSGTVFSGTGNVDPSFGNGGEIELAGSDARPRSGFGTWQIVTPDLGKVLTLTVSEHFGVPGAQNAECEAAVQGAYREH